MCGVGKDSLRYNHHHHDQPVVGREGDEATTTRRKLTRRHWWYRRESMTDSSLVPLEGIGRYDLFIRFVVRR